MLGPDYSDDLDYARSRLCDSLIRNEEGEPIYVNSIRENGYVEATTLLGEHNSLKLSKINVLPVPLGWCNWKHRSFYLVRLPERRWRQGLRQNCLRTTNATRVRPPSIYSISMRNTIVGNYPTLEECVEFVDNEESQEMAFSRRFCVGGRVGEAEFSLLHRIGNVGVIAHNGEHCNIRLHDKYAFLREELDAQSI